MSSTGPPQERHFPSGNVTVVYRDIPAGCAIGPYLSSGEEIWDVVEGELEMVIGDRRVAVAAGTSRTVPGNVVLSVAAPVPSRAIVVLRPRRTYWWWRRRRRRRNLLDGGPNVEAPVIYPPGAQEELGRELMRRIDELIWDLSGTKGTYDTWDKIMIFGSILFGIGTTVTAAAGLRIYAVALAALVTGTVSAQHWFALGPRARYAEQTSARLFALRLQLEARQVTPGAASRTLGQIEMDYRSGKPVIGTPGG